MKKLLIVALLLVCTTQAFAQKITHKRKVKLEQTLDAVVTDTLLAIASDSTIVKTNIAVSDINGGSPLKNQSDGLPNVDSTIDGYRTGKLGIGETNPTELLDVVGTTATGGINYDFTYTDGGVSRFQIGENILSELGVVGRTQGWIIDYFDNSVNLTTSVRGYAYAGDLTGAGVDNFTAGMGLASVNSDRFARTYFAPSVEGDDTDWWGRFQAKNSTGDFAEVVVRSDGVAVGYGLESQIDLYAYNVEGDGRRLYISPHWFDFNNGTIDLGTSYGSNVFTEGYSVGDTMAKTGSAETVIGASAFNLVVDSQGKLSTETLGQIKGYTVATLPGSPETGDVAYVTDATTPTYLAVVVGGGAVITPVFYNGSNWVCH